MPVAPLSSRSGYAGALDVLANFWFKQIELVDAREKAPPETNLEMSADAALAQCLRSYGITNEQSCVEGMFEDGFSMGLRVGAALVQYPFEAEVPLRRLLNELITVIRERREDAAASHVAVPTNVRKR